MTSHERFHAWFNIRLYYMHSDDSLAYLFRAELDQMNKYI